jgi:hypothetical protein
MPRIETHKKLVKTIREYVYLRLIKVKKRKDKYPNGKCSIKDKLIKIYYVDADNLDWIDSLIIHELGHYISATKYGFQHWPQSKPKRIIEEETRAWDESIKWMNKNYPNLVPKKIEYVRKYCLDTYRFHYGKS